MNIKDQTGAVLPITLVVIFVLTLLGIALLSYSFAETTQVAVDENSMKAHYVARSGANGVALYLIESPDSAVALINSPESNAVDFAQGQFKVLVYGEPGDEIYIKSTGTVRDAVQTIVVTLKEVGVDFALYGQSINVFGNARISGGDVVYGTTANVSEVVLDGVKLVKYPRNFDPVILPCDDSKSLFFGQCPDLSSAPYNGNVITESIRYGEIRLQAQLDHLKIEPAAGENLLLKADRIDLGNNKMTVKLNNNTVAVVVNAFDSGNGELYLEGNGLLMLYVNTYEGRGNFRLAPDSNVNVNVFVQAGGQIDLGGTSNFEGAIYAPHANTILFGNCTVNGWVIAGEAELGGNVRLYYKPILLGETGLDLTFYRLEKWRYDN